MLRNAILVTVADASVDEWMQQFGKTCDSNKMQECGQIFNDNMAFIESGNSKGHSYTLGWTPFTDLTSEEFEAGYLGFAAPSELFEGAVHLDNRVVTDEALAASMD